MKARSRVDPPPTERLFPRSLTITIIAAGLVCAALATFQGWRWNANRQHLTDVLTAAGIADAYPQAIERVDRELSISTARLLTSRSLVYRVLAVYAQPESSAEQRQAAGDSLPTARQLASAVLTEQPSSWQAAMLLGTATYLEWSLAQDRRLITESAAWEAPLQAAIDGAPGRIEPQRLLATAYLEIWRALSPAKKNLARELLRGVFAADLRAFQALSPAWMALHRDPAEAFEIIPQTPEPWQMIERQIMIDKNWSSLCLARQRRIEALELTLRAKRDEAAERLRLGDYFRGRILLLENIAKAPTTARFMPLVASSFEIYPPGLSGLRANTQIEAWLLWAADLEALGIGTMPPQVLTRMLDAAGELEDPILAAQIAQIAGDDIQAQRYERLVETMQVPIWAPYLVIKAQRALERGDTQTAWEALQQVAASSRDSLPYHLALQGAAPIGTESARADELLEALRRDLWSALDWRWRQTRPALDLLAQRDAAGFDIEMTQVPDAGAVVALYLDGAEVSCQTLYRDRTISLDAPISAGPHRLEIVALAGGRPAPGRVELIVD